MGTEARTEGNQQSTETPQGGSSAASGSPPGQGDGKQTQQTQTPSTKEKETSPAKEKETQTPSPRMLADEDDDIDDKAPYQITGSALKKRLGRFSKKQLRDHFGTDDPEQIKGRLKKLDELEAKAEEDRRAKLDEQERLKEDARREKERADNAEARVREVEENRVVEQQDRRLTTIAGKYIDSEVLDDVVLPKFARFLKKNYSEKEINSLKESDIEEWFKEYAEKHPKFAKEAPASAGANGNGGEKKDEKKPEEKKKVGLTTTAKAGDRPPPNAGGGGGEKTFKPGQPNSYTKEEMAKMGYRY